MLTVAGLVLMNIGLFVPTLDVDGGINWSVVLIFLGAGIGCIAWDINKEDQRLLRGGASYQNRTLRKKEAVLVVCTATSWFSGFFVSQALLGSVSFAVACLVWLGMSIGLSIWCKKVAREFQDSIRD